MGGEVLWRAMFGWLLLGWAMVAPGEAHVLDVPYRSQLDGAAYQLANCGPTALAMVLAYYGVEASPWDLRVRAMKAQQSWVGDDGGYSDSYGVFVYNMASVAEGMGLHPSGLWRREGGRVDRLHEWQAVELRPEIEAGRPVIVQVAYRALPRHAGSSAVAITFCQAAARASPASSSGWTLNLRLPAAHLPPQPRLTPRPRSRPGLTRRPIARDPSLTCRSPALGAA